MHFTKRKSTSIEFVVYSLAKLRPTCTLVFNQYATPIGLTALTHCSTVNNVALSHIAQLQA